MGHCETRQLFLLSALAGRNQSLSRSPKATTLNSLVLNPFSLQVLAE